MTLRDPVAITVTTANICGNPLRARRFVRRRMRRALAHAGGVFGQEVARSNRWGLRRRMRWAADYSEAWHRVAAVYNKLTVGGPREVPISAPKGWESLGWDSIKVHSGKRRVSPARYITVARYVVGGRKVAFVNCHPPSKPRRGVPFSRWRISRWNLYISKLADIVAELHSEGYTVTFGGDMNKRRRAIPQIHPDQELLISAGLDHLWAVPAEGMTVRVTRRRKVGRTALMDHPILTATFELQEAV